LHLIIGLGNPGERYARTRHNIGARALERAAAKWNVPFHVCNGARCGQGHRGTTEFVVAQPLTWMNQHGPSVKALLARFQVSLRHLIVVHDDLDLALGRLRLREDGGTGGHNGLRSIVDALGTNDFNRLKIGIGRPALGQDPAEYVLSPFVPDEDPVVDQALERAVSALECVLTEGMAAAMNRFNGRLLQEPS
jgi:PTH1 family peptidyl-tRNA hydrolase